MDFCLVDTTLNHYSDSGGSPQFAPFSQYLWIRQ